MFKPGSEGSVKDAVISLLSREWPLTARQIFSRVQSEAGISVSYQGVHKTLSLLVEQRVVDKDGTAYRVNKNWVSNLKSFGQSMESRLERTSFDAFASQLEKNGIVQVPFSNILEIARFLLGEFFVLSNPLRKPSLALWRNVYSIVGLAEKDYADLERGVMNGFFSVASESNPADKMFADSLEKYGVKSILGIPNVATELTDTFVVGDYVGVVWYPSDFREAWLNQNRLPMMVSDFDLGHHIKLMVSVRFAATFVCIRNPVLADQLRGTYLNYFKK